jgi:hypothetical protein
MLPFVRDSDRHHFVQVGLIDDSIDVSITSTVNCSVFDGFAFNTSGTGKVFLSIKSNYKQVNT